MCRPGRLHPWPALADAASTGARRVYAFVDREPRQLAGVVVIRHRLAQHEVRLPGWVRQSVPDLPELHPGRSSSNEQRHTKPAHQTISVGPDTKYIRNLIPTNLYAQDQWTLNRLTVQGGLRFDSLISNYPDQGIGGPGWPYAPVEIFFPSRSTPGYKWKDLTPRCGRGLRLVREWEDGRQVQHRQVSGSHHGEQQRSGHEPADPNGHEHDTRVDRRGQRLRAGLRSQQPEREW